MTTRFTVVTDAGALVTTLGPVFARGPKGDPGSVALVRVGAAPLSGHSVVALGADGALVPADCTHAAHLGAVMGMVASAYTAGADALVSNNAPLAHAGWAWVPGPVLLGTFGLLTQQLPPGALFAQVIGRAVSATCVLIDVQPPVSLT